jgi:hypothetical protein
MITYLNIGGEDRPFMFSNKCAYQFELATGLPYLQEIRAFQVEVGRAVQAMQANGGAEAEGSIDAVSGISMKRLADLAFSGFAYAHRTERVPLTFDVEDVVGWLIEEPQALQIVASEIILATSQKQDDEAPAAKKKTVAKPKGRK